MSQPAIRVTWRPWSARKRQIRSLIVRAKTWWMPGRPFAVGGPSKNTKGRPPRVRSSVRAKSRSSRQRARSSRSSASAERSGQAGSGMRAASFAVRSEHSAKLTSRKRRGATRGAAACRPPAPRPRGPPLDPERLLRERVLSPVASTSRASSRSAGFAHSGTACFVRDRDGRRYKLRACASAGRAREIERLLAREPRRAFPRVLGREGRWLLIEALDEHRALEREELLERLGRRGRDGRRAPRGRAARRPAEPAPGVCAPRCGRACSSPATSGCSRRAGVIDARDRATRSVAKLRAHRRRFGFPGGGRDGRHPQGEPHAARARRRPPLRGRGGRRGAAAASRASPRW